MFWKKKQENKQEEKTIKEIYQENKNNVLYNTISNIKSDMEERAQKWYGYIVKWWFPANHTEIIANHFLDKWYWVKKATNQQHDWRVLIVRDKDYSVPWIEWLD